MDDDDGDGDTFIEDILNRWRVEEEEEAEAAAAASPLQARAPQLWPPPTTAAPVFEQFYWHWDFAKDEPHILPNRGRVTFALLNSARVMCQFSTNYGAVYRADAGELLRVSWIKGDIPSGIYDMKVSPPRMYPDVVTSVNVRSIKQIRASKVASEYPRVEAVIIQDKDGRIIGPLEGRIFTWMENVIPVVVDSKLAIHRETEASDRSYAYLVYDRPNNVISGLYLSTFHRHKSDIRTPLLRCAVSVYRVVYTYQIGPGHSANLLNFCRLDARLATVGSASIIDYMAYRARARPRFEPASDTVVDLRCMASRYQLPKSAHTE